MVMVNQYSARRTVLLTRSNPLQGLTWLLSAQPSPTLWLQSPQAGPGTSFGQADISLKRCYGVVLMTMDTQMGPLMARDMVKGGALILASLAETLSSDPAVTACAGMVGLPHGQGSPRPAAQRLPPELHVFAQHAACRACQT